MAFDYARTRATAERMIAKFGGPTVLAKQGPLTGPSYDPVPGPWVDHPVIAAKFDERLRDRTGTLIDDTIRTYIVSTEGLSVVPTKGDRIDGAVIEEVRPLQPVPGGVIVMWEVDV